MSSLDTELLVQLSARREAHLYRARRTLESPQNVRVQVNGSAYLGFSSNDYLGLANDSRVTQALHQGIDLYGAGSGASHLVLGHSKAHHQLEDALAEFTGRERVLLFSTGYMANLGVLSALAGRGDRILQDRLNHASLLDGGLLSGAKFKRYRHADPESLKALLDSPINGRTLVVTDGVFSMDGNLAPLAELVNICSAAGAHLVVDDAHGFGCLGQRGAGVAEHFQLDQTKLPVLIGTLGKAFGTSGAFVAGSEALIEYLIQFARPYIYTTAIPPAIAHATLTSLKILQSESWRREHLAALIKTFKAGAAALGYQLMRSDTPIQPILVGESEQAMKLSKTLETKGILVGAIRPPTVPKGEARLRVTLSASHTQQDLSLLLKALEQAREELMASDV